MKKLKKLFAVILSLAMVLGMSMTALAVEGDTTITVSAPNNEELGNVSLSYVQIIKPDQTTATGWNFTTDQIAAAYLGGFGLTDSPENRETVIEELVALQKTSPNGYANSNKIGMALSAVVALTKINPATQEEESILDPMSNPQNVTSAGVYAVKATQEDYTYNNMAAYVGFGEVDGSYPALESANLTVKRSKISLDKSHNDEDKVSAIGSTVEYTIKTNVPYINPKDTNKTYYIHDAIKGADYVMEGDNVKKVSVTLAGTTLDEINGQPVILEPKGPTTVSIKNEDGSTKTVECTDSFAINLSGLIDDQNTHAGEEIIVKYQAVVTEETVDNKANAGHLNGNEYGSEYGEDDDKIFTGRITLTKTGEDSERLANAGFEVTTGTPEEVVYFKKNGEGDYTHVETDAVPDDVKTALKAATDGKKTSRTELEVEKDGVTYVTQVFTKDGNANEKGTVIVRGLNVGTYKFTEKTAPEGYSVNTNPSSATLVITEENGKTGDDGELIATEILEANTSMTDTRLSSLPSTGGIGTTIFTIGGCAIMIIAAALFFASRRKSSDAK